ncbi:nicotinate-nucleotide--dimethylbenzimidazole phosphoribosyltransferase [Corynebacterium anserum]|uniref:Nicotinate-nucleotide--dimethylbenzimidazole phosphoribosyltransferase n=1 Tax=Corynebacterium anserum TaxID=2684406 RepID=A0A7G7YMV3_9CORY|nr:nicotinate-nucleotide--dimethylbenzimidazole phosphoribosyltransferase [Corynebacterium anserum]MBC2680950.1 nicotinate-nucleotide--dimethylbenzimidazole phosphoribosyltransferase [Corynebacterium anserum]QNH95823.1 nicotinate-nucleotide--dimethylbenzimidazole phosphoribosyltransferase [Corynebacterium anserum]
MSQLPDFPPVIPPDEEFRRRATAWRSDIPTEFGMPNRSLGRLEQLGAWLAACQSTVPPRPLTDVQLVVVGGTHGVARTHPEISALPETFSQDVLAAISQGRSPLLSAATAEGIRVSVRDADSSHPSGSIDYEDAMTSAELFEYMSRGIEIADDLADQGTQLVLLGDAGRGVTTVAAAIIGSICSIEPVKVVGRGSGISDEAWKTKTAVIRDAMYRVRDDKADASRILRRIGSPDFATLAGLLAQCSVRRTPVLFDGVGTTAAALCAQMMVPGAADWWIAASAGDEPAHVPALKALRKEPLLTSGIGTGQGLGAILAFPLLRHAVDALNFESHDTPMTSELD